MQQKRFSTFDGVFTPCLLSILGVIMYLRLGWVVGQVGFAGTLGIIFLANLITLATALSMSSIVTNIRIGAGGAYSIIAKSLGLEAAGAIGVPLYISQAISVAFYITGFSECWSYVFPHHVPLFVSLLVWFILFIISYLSAEFGFRLQHVVMGIIGLSIVSIIFGKNVDGGESLGVTFFSTVNFWHVFAIFFPAVTGVLAGASMSGELIEPKKNIPQGTLWAIVVSFLIYVILTYCFATQASAEALSSNVFLAIDMGRWKGIVIAGIMGATLSSGLAMFIGAPRVLFALGKHSLVPFSSSFYQSNKKGEPTNAILLTALISLATVLLGNLNQIAGLLTMFFLITYGMINVSVFIEQTIGIVSFRPSFRVSKFVPFLGGLGCLVVMFLIDARFSIIAIVAIIVIYMILIKREANIYSPDVRSGMLVFLAERFANAAHRLPYYPKIWKPNLIIPFDNVASLTYLATFIQHIVAPAGRTSFVHLVDLEKKKLEKKVARDELKLSVESLTSSGIFVETIVVDSEHKKTELKTVIQTMRGMVFTPNTLFYMLNETKQRDPDAKDIIKLASEEGMGIIVLNYDRIGFGGEKRINLWIRQNSPNVNLAILIALQLQRNWDGHVRILQVVEDSSERDSSIKHLEKLKDISRMPSHVTIDVLVGTFMDKLKNAPQADINIFGMAQETNIEPIYEVTNQIKTSVLYIKDSSHESAVA